MAGATAGAGDIAGIPAAAGARDTAAGPGATGCAGPAVGAGGASSVAQRTVAVRMLHVGRGRIAVAGVCIDGAGPFPFVVDSGSAVSVVSSALAHRFRLRQLAPPGEAQGIACRAPVVPEQVTAWSIGRVGLRPQPVLVASVPPLGRRQSLDGLIGADVLSRFGAVRFEYRSSTVAFARPESPSRAGNGAIERASSLLVPKSFIARVVVRVRLRVISNQGAVTAYAPVRFHGSSPQQFLVDSGAAASAVSPRVTASLHLAALDRRVSYAAFGCTVTMTDVASGRWKLGGSPLASQPLAELPASGVQVEGLLGSDVLSAYGAAVIDYAHAQLLLERG
jgi:hypothetical protein